MDTKDLLIVAIVAVLAVAVAGYLVYSKRQSQRLQRRFGPEYAEAVNQFGSRARAEAELKKREKRVERFKIVPLTPAEADRFAQAWTRLQGSFVDDPKGVLVQAGQLVGELLRKRGFPMADFERLAADISVDHPSVVSNYRAAQLILSRDQRGEADTEELRRAVVHFRALFDELLEARTARAPVAPATKIAA
jgi:hypothetical protein